ncbi:MAG: hypothetical protein ACK5ME_08745 [Parahaliea sp.]
MVPLESDWLDELGEDEELELDEVDDDEELEVDGVDGGWGSTGLVALGQPASSRQLQLMAVAPSKRSNPGCFTCWLVIARPFWLRAYC